MLLQRQIGSKWSSVLWTRLLGFVISQQQRWSLTVLLIYCSLEYKCMCRFQRRAENQPISGILICYLYSSEWENCALWQTQKCISWFWTSPLLSSYVWQPPRSTQYLRNFSSHHLFSFFQGKIAKSAINICDIKYQLIGIGLLFFSNPKVLVGPDTLGWIFLTDLCQNKYQATMASSCFQWAEIVHSQQKLGGVGRNPWQGE